jgi:hypothetical protein
VAASENVKNLSKWQTLKEPQVLRLGKVLYKWLTAMHSEGKPMSGHMAVEKAKTFYDEM